MKKITAFLAALILILGNVTAQTKVGTKKSTAKETKYRVVIDFISKGAGIDAASYEKILGFIKAHPKKPVYVSKQKGKEGDVKLSLKLNELTPEEQVTFVNDVKLLIVKEDLVLITENLPKVAVLTDAVNKPVTYRLVISFISKGAGTDIKSHEGIMQYVEKHPKKPAFETKRWGREGEVDYCFRLKELSADEQKTFIKDVQKHIFDKEMVFIHENQEYVKKGR